MPANFCVSNFTSRDTPYIGIWCCAHYADVTVPAVLYGQDASAYNG